MSKQPDCLGDRTVESVHEVRTADVIYFHFSKAFDTVSHIILVSKSGLYVLDGWTTR